MVLLTAAAVALAVVLSAAACYLAVESSVRGRLDRQLQTFAQGVATGVRYTSAASLRSGPPGKPGMQGRQAKVPRPSLGDQGDAAVFNSVGALQRSPEDRTTFVLTRRDLAVARGAAGAYFRDATVAGVHLRVYVTPAGSGHAVIAEQSLSDVEGTLHDLAVILTAIGLAGVALAGALGLFVARAAAAPVHTLRRAAEHVRQTGDLSRRIATTGADDLGRLGTSFNTMLAALERSQRAQSQLIADASHELRTPVATLRTNLEVLARNPELDASERTPLLADLIEQSGELGALIGDLLETARDGDGAAAMDTVDLREIVSEEVARLAARERGLRFESDLRPVRVLAHEPRLRRALVNLLDNAVKWSPPGGTVSVSLHDGGLTVSDEGPGFAPGDLPHVFDRFYRSAVARSVPGCGLGLSIVEKIAREHGGAVTAANGSQGGAVVQLSLPCLGPAAPAPAPVTARA
jgi:two-component system sensor histidine kinase MprB